MLESFLRRFWRLCVIFVLCGLSGGVAADPAAGPDNLEFSLPSGQWRQLSLPCAPAGEARVASLFGDDLPGGAGVDWALYAFDTAANRYRLLTPDDHLAPGRGYWIIQTSGDTVTLSYAASCPASDAAGVAPLATRPGAVQWNMAGYPLPGERPAAATRVRTESGDCADGCSLSQAAARGIAHQTLWRYDPSRRRYVTLAEDGRWRPWQGYWVATLDQADGLAPRLVIPAAHVALSDYRVYVGAQASEAEQYAADELIRYIAQTTGTQLARIDHYDPEGGPLFVIGADNDYTHARGIAIDPAQTGEDGFLWHRDGDNLLIAGATPRGSLYGVYEYLRQYFGVEWYAIDTTFTPDKSDLSAPPLPAADEIHRPRFRFREVFSPEAEQGEFAARVMLNGQTEGRMVDQPLTRQLGGGLGRKGVFNIGTAPGSSAQTLDEAVASLTQAFDSAPDFTPLVYPVITHIDGGSRNTDDPDDQQLVERNGGAAGAPLMLLTTRVADRIRASHPEATVLGEAYLWSLQPPTAIDFPDNAGVSFAPIEADWARPLNQGAINAPLADDLRGWAQRTAHVWSWLYTTNFSGYLQPLPTIEPMISTLKWLATIPQVEGIMLQDSYTTKAGSFAALHAWLYARLMWDPTLDGDALIDQFCNGYYGPRAGPLIREYIRKLHESAAASGDVISTKTRANLPYLNARLLIEADALMAQAETSAADNPLYLKHVRIERMGVDWTILLNDARLKQEAQRAGLQWPDASETDRQARLSRLRHTIVNVAGMDSLGEGTGDIDAVLTALETPAIVPPALCPPMGRTDDQCIDFQDLGFALSEASITADPLASDHRAAVMAGDVWGDEGGGWWGIQASLQTLLPANDSQQWDLFANVRVDINRAGGYSPDSDVIAFSAGVDPGDSRDYSLRDFGDEQYHVIKLAGGPRTYDAQASVWFAPANRSDNPPPITHLYVDRVFAVRHDSAPNIFRLREFRLYDDDAVMTFDPASDQGFVARMNSGHTAWAIQAPLAGLLPDDRDYDLYASIRLEPGAAADNAPVLNTGVEGNGVNVSRAITADQLSTSEYRLIRLPGGAYNRGQLSADGESPVLWFQPATENGPPFHVDKVVARPVGDGETHPVASRQAASAFLARATFGPDASAIDDLVARGTYEQWLDEQFSLPPTLHLQWAEDNVRGVNGTGDLEDNPEDWRRHSDTLSYLQRDVWWHIATQGADQLRQRVALALSEIFVVSKNNGVLVTQPDARMSYYDLLVRDAFANFETLLRDVTWHPSMGKYLSYLGNPRAGTTPGSHPDENYAREVMQLFTIGLYQLNPDGSRQLDANGKPIPTYSQRDVREMARVFTGLTDQNGYFFASDGGSSHFSRISPMIADESYHDQGVKQVLGRDIATGSTRGDIEAALHILFEHPNTGPFIARRLIQRLVTSNPSPQYIERVARVFDDNGEGVRGDLKAVVKAVLLDDEALHGAERFPQTFGKFREPLLYLTHLFRAFHARDAEKVFKLYDEGPYYRYRSYHYYGADMTRQEGPLEALTVFNYFTPDDGPYSLRRQGLVAPELSLYGKRGIDDLLMGIINKNSFVYDLFGLTADLQIDREKDWVAAHDYDALLDELDLVLTGGHLGEDAKTAIRDYLVRQENATDDNGQPLTADRLARYAIGLVMTSPDYALQR